MFAVQAFREQVCQTLTEAVFSSDIQFYPQPYTFTQNNFTILVDFFNENNKKRLQDARKAF